jgi:hypothetical protein
MAATPLRRKIEAMLPEMEEPLTLDFDGIRSASSSFLDELLGRLAAGIGPEEFQRRIRIANAPRVITDMANVVVAQRLELER